VANNLAQAHQNFIDARYESCNAMLRTALESTLEHVAKHFVGNLDDIQRANPNYQTLADVRRYLSECEFLSDDERAVIDKLYSFACPNGSHPGMSNEAESRLRRLMIVGWIQYCLEKLRS
jgi:hypothetical protein